MGDVGPRVDPLNADVKWTFIRHGEGATSAKGHCVPYRIVIKPGLRVTRTKLCMTVVKPIWTSGGNRSVTHST